MCRLQLSAQPGEKHQELFPWGSPVLPPGRNQQDRMTDPRLPSTCLPVAMPLSGINGKILWLQWALSEAHLARPFQETVGVWGSGSPDKSPPEHHLLLRSHFPHLPGRPVAYAGDDWDEREMWKRMLLCKAEHLSKRPRVMGEEQGSCRHQEGDF